MENVVKNKEREEVLKFERAQLRACRNLNLSLPRESLSALVLGVSRSKRQVLTVSCNEKRLFNK